MLPAFSPWGASQPADAPAAAFALLALIAALMLPSGREASALLRWRPVWAYAAFLGWALVSAAVSGRPFSAVFGAPATLAGWLTLALSGVIALEAVQRRRDLRRLMSEYYAPGLLWIQSAFALGEIAVGSQGHGTLSNSTYLGAVIVLMLPIAAADVPERPSQAVRIWRGGAIVAGIATLAASGSRVALAASLIWLAWQGIRSLRSVTARVKLWLLVGAAALTAALAYLAERFAPAEMTPGSVAFSLADRFALWQPALDATLRRPVVGWGPDGFVAGAPRVMTASAVRINPNLGLVSADPHQLLLWVLVSTGFVGFALFAWVVFEMVRNWWLQRGATPSASPLIWAVALYGLVVMTAPAPIQTLPLLLLVLGASLRVEKPRSALAENPIWPLPARIVAVLLAAVFGLYAVSNVPLGRIDKVGQQSPPGLTQSIADAWHFDPYLYYLASLSWGFQVIKDQSLAVGKPDLVDIQRAVTLEPGSGSYWLELARTLDFYSAPSAQVEAAYRRALALFPESPEALTAIGRYLLGQGDTAGARDKLEAALTARPDDPGVVKFAIEFYTKTGDSKKAAEYQNILKTLPPAPTPVTQ